MKPWVLIASLTCVGGCAPAELGRDLPPPVAQVDQVHLLVLVSPLRDLNGNGPDSVAMEIFFEKGGLSGGVPVAGSLEILMFEGDVRRDELSGKRPFHVEKYSNSDLRDGASSNVREGISPRLGISYRCVVPWGPHPPVGPMITVVARYIPPAGPAVLSEPAAFPVHSS